MPLQENWPWIDIIVGLNLQPLLYHPETSSEIQVHSSSYRNSLMLLFGGSLRCLAQKAGNVLGKPG